MSKKSDELDHVYGASSADEIKDVYAGWASAYDEDNLKKGYRLATLGTAYVARYVPRESGAILDAGCGTGLVGEALKILGYGEIDGVDLSPEMVGLARERGVYDNLTIHDLSQPLKGCANSYSAVLCFASFGPGHAPPQSLDHLLRVLRPGGYAIFNLREDTYEDQGFGSKMAELADKGIWREVERSEPFNPYLLAEPDLFARFFVFEKSA